MTDLIEFARQLEGYTDVCDKGDAGVCAIVPLVYTRAIITGISTGGYENRYCFPSYDDARRALDAWDGEGEPVGYIAKRGS